MVITLAFVIFRIPCLRDQLFQTGRYGSGRIILIAIFSALAIYGTHAGVVVSNDGKITPVPWLYELSKGEAIINFRDLVVVTAGLAGGPWLGISVGAIAGFERYHLGGFTALSCGLASLLSGVLAGLFRQKLGTRITPVLAAGIAALAVIVQMALILAIAQPFEQAWILVKHIGFPMLLTATVGGYVFQQVIQVLDHDRLELLARRAEIRALHAQIEPHFLMNTLNAIKALIRIDSEKARQYIDKLGGFLQEASTYAKADTITVKEELEHVYKYLDFQRLRFEEPIHYHEMISDAALLKCPVPPRTLHTLVENALVHGYHSTGKPRSITVTLDKCENFLKLVVADEGRGIPPERLARIGKEPVSSTHKDGGHALHQLQQTLQLMWGDNARLEISSQVTLGTRVTLFLPLCQNDTQG